MLRLFTTILAVMALSACGRSDKANAARQDDAPAAAKALLLLSFRKRGKVPQ